MLIGSYSQTSYMLGPKVQFILWVADEKAYGLDLGTDFFLFNIWIWCTAAIKQLRIMYTGHLTLMFQYIA